MKIKWVNFNYKNKYIYLFREREGEKKRQIWLERKKLSLFSKANWYVFRELSERIQWLLDDMALNEIWKAWYKWSFSQFKSELKRTLPKGSLNSF